MDNFIPARRRLGGDLPLMHASVLKSRRPIFASHPLSLICAWASSFAPNGVNTNTNTNKIRCFCEKNRAQHSNSSHSNFRFVSHSHSRHLRSICTPYRPPSSTYRTLEGKLCLRYCYCCMICFLVDPRTSRF